MGNSNLLTKDETCPGPRKCNSWEMSEIQRKAAKTDEELAHWVNDWVKSNPNPTGYDSRTWFYICSYCKRLRRDQLIECPSCHKYFKGPRPNFTIDYECEECDV